MCLSVSYNASVLGQRGRSWQNARWAGWKRWRFSGLQRVFASCYWNGLSLQWIDSRHLSETPVEVARSWNRRVSIFCHLINSPLFSHMNNIGYVRIYRFESLLNHNKRYITANHQWMFFSFLLWKLFHLNKDLILSSHVSYFVNWTVN